MLICSKQGLFKELLRKGVLLLMAQSLEASAAL